MLREKQNISHTFHLIESTESLLLHHGLCFLQVLSSLQFALFPACLLLLNSEFQIQATPRTQHNTCEANELCKVSSADSPKKLKCFPSFKQQSSTVLTRFWWSFLLQNKERKQKHSRSYGEIFRCALCILGNLSAVRETEIILLGSILFSKAYLIVIPILTKRSKKLCVKENVSQHPLFSFSSSQVCALPPEGNWNMLLSSFIRLFYSWVLYDIGFWIKLALNKFLATVLFPMFLVVDSSFGHEQVDIVRHTVNIKNIFRNTFKMCFVHGLAFPWVFLWPSCPLRNIHLKMRKNSIF